jgi:hypothetical protein
MTDAAADPQTKEQVRSRLPAATWAGIRALVRRDGVAILLYALTTILMTYPLAFRLGGEWLALRDTDTYMKLWDNWWLQNHAFNQPSLTFTDVLFHPIGLDLSFHSISWTVAFLSWLLTILSDAITAYNLTILIAIFATAYAAYLLARQFVRYRAAAWLAGAIYSFAPYHIAHAGGHTDLIHLAPIPLAVLLLFVAVTQSSALAALGAALMVGMAAFTSLYIMVFALLTVGPVLLFLLLDGRRWSKARVWRVVVLFGLASALLLGMRLIPIFRDVGALAEAIEAKYAASDSQTDLLSYVLPSHLNPLFAPLTKEIASRFGHMSRNWPAYLGIIPLALSAGALTWRKRRRLAMLWLSIGLLFAILSLGPVLSFNGSVYEDIVLPAQLLSWFPPIRAVGRPDFFVIGVLLPLAMLAALGFDRLLIRLEGQRTFQIALMIALPGLLLVEFWSGPFPGGPSRPSSFYEQLAREPGDFAIIQLPMGRSESKRYLYLPTIHQKAIVEGLSGRTPPEAYSYIQGNHLLNSWFSGEPLDCATLPRRRFASALDQLIDDDFRYVVVHHAESEFPARFAEYLPYDPIYQDRGLTAFKLDDLLENPPCHDVYERVMDPPSPDISTSISWDGRIELLGYDLHEVDPSSETLVITVYWRAMSESESSFVSFFHLIDPATGLPVAQADIIPRGWSYPTNWWVEGEVVEDTVRIPLESVPAGRYELRIGWYDEESGIRLTPKSDQSPLFSDSSALLTVIDS